MLTQDSPDLAAQVAVASGDRHQEVTRIYELLGLTEDQRARLNLLALAQPAGGCRVQCLHIGLTNNSNDK